MAVSVNKSSVKLENIFEIPPAKSKKSTHVKIDEALQAGPARSRTMNKRLATTEAANDVVPRHHRLMGNGNGLNHCFTSDGKNQREPKILLNYSSTNRSSGTK